MMKSRIIAVFLILLADHPHSSFGQVQCGVRGNPSTKNFIVGGDEVEPLEFPWQISLQVFNSTTNRWEHICGGSIIDKNWLFTAAHCLDTRFVNGNLRVVAGAHNISRSEASASTQEIVRSRDVIIHPMWNMDLLDYDYGLIQFPTQLDFSGSHSHLRPICMPTANENLFENMDCMISGWGLTHNSEDTKDQPDVLQKLPVHIQPFEECKLAWISHGSEVQRLTPRHICASSKRGEGTGPCKGDLGGPLQCQLADHYVLAGATSFSRDCGSSQYPAVYARVGEVLDWVDRVKAIRTRAS